QLLHRQLAAGLVGVSKRLRHPPLVVEGEPVVAPPRRVVQLVADPPEQVARRPRRAHLAVWQESPLAGLAEARHLVAHPGDPERRLQVAQPALALLQVWLEQPDRSAVATAALVELLQLVADELLDAALLQLGDRGALEALEQLRVTAEEPSVEERGADGVVLAGELDALVQRARGVARFQPGIPETPVELLRDLVRARPARIL